MILHQPVRKGNDSVKGMFPDQMPVIQTNIHIFPAGSRIPAHPLHHLLPHRIHRNPGESPGEQFLHRRDGLTQGIGIEGTAERAVRGKGHEAGPPLLPVLESQRRGHLHIRIAD